MVITRRYTCFPVAADACLAAADTRAIDTGIAYSAGWDAVYEQRYSLVSRTTARPLPSSSVIVQDSSMRLTSLLVTAFALARTVVALTEFQYLQAAKDFADSFLSPRNAEIAASINS